ncbi:phytanoyl-CoA dioxygenase family protein [Oligoflexus tunisiensis]|uniref:phytanoyl-CoA dioxygenase family protein n=1 Tax=Oligoflexus tunisiensis TaxID=708132 RepID=UPI000B1CF1ED|nr:phytanoyl-CoA dioxygenase family protein [Oligoflexus tunisiensis]
MPNHRYTPQELSSLTQKVLKDGYCVLEQHFSPAVMQHWNEQFMPLLRAYIDSGGSTVGRGPARYYVTLPFEQPFADPTIFEDDDILSIVEGLVGEDFVMCQLATDTPLLGSDYQDVHRDAPPLFPEFGIETPPFQLAINFPLVEVTRENGPFEIAAGTHLWTKAERMERTEKGEVKLEPVPMKLGDVMVRDVRALHRGTPNQTPIPRPMVVIGYSRKWLLRPEVSIDIPRSMVGELSHRARRMLRYNPIVDAASPPTKHETYDTYSY